MDIMKGFYTILNTVSEGILIVDERGNIVFFNSAYGNFIEVPLEMAVGRPLTDFRPNAIMPRALKEGKSYICTLRHEYGKDYFASIYPILENGMTVGGISVVTFLESAEYFAQTLKSLKERETYWKTRMATTNGTQYTFDNIICKSESSMKCIETAKRLAHIDASVLLQGESGCGKELFAQAIHNESERREYPFIAINCAAISHTMLESELFGYEEGAFTGAKRDGKLGLFEAAEHGTVFLDEISEMDMELQTKLLRVLQEKKMRRLGGTEEINVDVRIISACNVDLMKYIDSGKFRLDLYYRIAVVPLYIAPLRERRDDIIPLVKNHLKTVSIQKKQLLDISDEALKFLCMYDWPGNIRELHNILEYAGLMCQTSHIELTDLPDTMIKGEEQSSYDMTLAERVKQFEKREINKLLEKNGKTVEGKKKTAEMLGISLASLYSKLAS